MFVRICCFVVAVAGYLAIAGLLSEQAVAVPSEGDTPAAVGLEAAVGELQGAEATTSR